jgi:hypothetical protein
MTYPAILIFWVISETYESQKFSYTALQKLKKVSGLEPQIKWIRRVSKTIFLFFVLAAKIDKTNPSFKRGVYSFYSRNHQKSNELLI